MKKHTKNGAPSAPAPDAVEQRVAQRLGELAGPRYLCTLLGGYCCELTAAQRNEWQLYLTRDCATLYRSIMLSESLVARAINGQGNIEQHRKRYDDLLDNCYDLARAWHEGILRRQVVAR